MCDELGNEENMMAYIEDYGNTSLCIVKGEGYPGCDDKEKGYIEKMSAKSPDEIKGQLDRLEKMDGGSMTDDLRRWMMKRKKILKQLVAVGDNGGEGSDEL
jgi:hypothetical protein